MAPDRAAAVRGGQLMVSTVRFPSSSRKSLAALVVLAD
jgi:hypothetical protein